MNEKFISCYCQFTWMHSCWVLIFFADCPVWAFGCWLSIVVCRLLAVDCQRLSICWWLSFLVVIDFCCKLNVGCWLSVVIIVHHYKLMIVGCWLSALSCWLSAVIFLNCCKLQIVSVNCRRNFFFISALLWNSHIVFIWLMLVPFPWSLQ